MARKHPHSFDFYVDDFLGGTSAMTAEETGIYIRLLLYQFQQGSVPGDPDRIRRIVGAGQETDWKPMGFVLDSKFRKVQDGSYVNDRMAEVRDTTFKRYETNVANGRKGGRPKRIEQNNAEYVDENGKPKQNPAVSKTETQTKPNGKREEGRGKKEEGRGSPDYSEAFALFWNAYPKRNGKKRHKAEAFKLWKSLSADDQASAAKASAIYAASEDAKMNFAVDPPRFLRNRYWEDWLEPADPPTHKSNGNGKPPGRGSSGPNRTHARGGDFSTDRRRLRS